MKFKLINESKTLSKYEIDINIIFDYLKSKRKTTLNSVAFLVKILKNPAELNYFCKYFQILIKINAFILPVYNIKNYYFINF